MDRKRWLELQSTSADPDSATGFFDAMVPQGITRVVVKERDRAALQGSLPGEGYRLVVEVFIETGPRGRIATWRLDIRRPRGDDIGRQPWRIVSQDRLASIEGLHRLALHPDKQFAARNLVLQAVDFELRLPAGDVFVAETPEGMTGLVLLGDGTLVFEPSPKEERGQLKLFAGTESLETPFTSAFVRISPFEFESRLKSPMLEPVALDPRAHRRGLDVFDEDVPKSFNLDLSDLSREVWSLLPQPGDFVAEVKTRRFDDLTYARSSGEAEDVTVFQRGRKRNISAYASEQKLQSRGRFFDEDDLVDYDVLDYDIDASFYPDREWMEGRTRMRVRVKSHMMGVLTLRFAETAARVVGDERRVRTAAVPARPQSEFGAGEPAAAGGARFSADADHHLLGTPRTPADPGRVCRRTQRRVFRPRRLRTNNETRNPTIFRSSRRSRSGCSAIATTGIRRTRSPITPRRAFA